MRGQTKKPNQATAGRRRSRLPDDHALLLASHVTERDRRIAVDCYEHHVLTTDQISRLYFPKPRGATARLQTLYELRVLDRFRPSRKRGEGTLPFHWVLE
jgi:Replication-relaxation